jgi:hypothetical protein
MVGGNILKQTAADQLCYQCILAKAKPSDSENLLITEHKLLSLVDLIRPTPIRLLPVTFSVFEEYTFDEEEEKQEVQSVSMLERRNERDSDDNETSLEFDCSFAESLRYDGARHPEPEEDEYDGDISYLSHELEELVLSMIMHQKMVRPVAIRPVKIAYEV